MIGSYYIRAASVEATLVSTETARRIPGDIVLWTLLRHPQFGPLIRPFLTSECYITLGTADLFWSIYYRDLRLQAIGDISSWNTFVTDRLIEQIQIRELERDIERWHRQIYPHEREFYGDSDTDTNCS